MEKIHDKIRKLLRLARDKGASENEAANAMAMASRLMFQHNIEHVSDEELASDPVRRGSWMGVDRGDKWESIVAATVAKLYSCRHCVSGDDHQFVGKSANIQACQETFIWVCEQVEILYKEGLRTFKSELGGALDQRLRAEFRKNFKNSCAMTLWRRAGDIVAANRGNIPDHKALVIIDQSLEQADDLLKNLKKGKSLKVRTSGLGSGAGQSAADRVKLQSDMSDKRRGNPASLQLK